MLPELPDPVRDVARLVAAMPGVVAVLLGGSRVNATATTTSDWDLGICYRGELDLTALAGIGSVHPPGSWGRLMNGGAWLTVDGIRVDALLRDLDAIEHWTSEAQHGRFEVDGLLGYLAGMPTYTLTAEVACSVVLHGGLEIPTGYPEALASQGAPRWRFCRDFSLSHARRAAELGNEVMALGQLARASVEEAHARHCERGEWVLNEKRIFAGTGLSASFPIEPGRAIGALIDRVAAELAAPAELQNG